VEAFGWWKGVIEYGEEAGTCAMSGGGGCESNSVTIGCVPNSAGVGVFLRKRRRAETIAPTATRPPTVPPAAAPTGNLEGWGVGEVVGVEDELGTEAGYDAQEIGRGGVRMT